MFKKILYFDKKSVLDFYEIASSKSSLEIKGKASINTGIVGAELEFSKNKGIDQSGNLVLLCNAFEQAISHFSGDHYFDFINEDQGWDISSVPASSIIRFEAEIEIPEDFDYMDLIDKMSEFLPEAAGVKTTEEKELFKIFFETKGRKLPCLARSDNFDDGVYFSKINPSYILNDVSVEDLLDRSLKILASISSFKKYKEKPIVVFDIYKDFFCFNRIMRRQIGRSDSDFKQELCVEENLVNIEILAIYC